MINLSLPLRHIRLTAIANAIDAGPQGGWLRLYTGPRPNPGANLDQQTRLAELQFPTPSLTQLNNGELTLGIASDILCQASGFPVWARLTDSNNLWVMDIDVGLPSSGADLELGPLPLYAGGLLKLQPIVISE